jgi:branched-chain amino acid transport system ATP-binding protein
LHLAVADSSETSPRVGVRETLMLKITNLETTYNDIILALKGISLEVPPKSIVAVLGSNGAGKTTTINTISGIRKTLDLAVQDGSIEFEGEIIHDREPHEIVARGIVQVPEGRRIFAELTVAENILIGSYAMAERKGFSSSSRARERVFHYFPILRERSRQPAGYLSGGEQQMLAISRALVASPKLMMMDEPSLGLAPILVTEIFEITGRINQEEGVAILLVEQNANMALSIAHYGYILENGRVVMEGPRERLREDRDIREFYLGLTEVGAKRSYKEVKHYKRRKRWLS